MNIKDFEAKLKEIDPLFTVSANPNRGASGENKFGLNNIFFNGQNYDLPVVPDQVKDEIDPNYRYVFPNGAAPRCWSSEEILGRVEAWYKQFKSGKLDDDYAKD